MKRLLITVAALLLFTAHATLAAEEEQKTKKPLGPAETVAAFLDAALNGRNEEAAAMGDPETPFGRADKISAFTDLKLSELAVEQVYADDTGALGITAKFKDNRGRDGLLVLMLAKKEAVWLVHDIDFENDDSVEDEVKRFLDKHPKAKLIPKAKAPAKDEKAAD